jgi:hypothetical protein
MAILRHAQISITMEIDTEVPDEVTRAALKRLGQSLGSDDAKPDPSSAANRREDDGSRGHSGGR